MAYTQFLVRSTETLSFFFFVSLSVFSFACFYELNIMQLSLREPLYIRKVNEPHCTEMQCALFCLSLFGGSLLCQLTTAFFSFSLWLRLGYILVLHSFCFSLLESVSNSGLRQFHFWQLHKAYAKFRSTAPLSLTLVACRAVCFYYFIPSALSVEKCLLRILCLIFFIVVFLVFRC